MPLPVAIPAVLAVGAWASRFLGVVKLAAVFFALQRIYWLLSLLAVAFWTAVMFYAKELFVWVTEVMMKMVGVALEAAGMEDPGPTIVGLAAQLPPQILELWARLDVWDGFATIFAAYALNMALRSIPLIGGVFRG